MVEAQAGARSASPWTTALRFAIIGWYALSALWSLTLPPWLIRHLALIIWSTQTLGGEGPIPQGVAPQYIGEATIWVWALTVLIVAIDAAGIVGAATRRTWGFVLAMILLIPWSLYLPLLIWNSLAWPWLGWTALTAVNAALFAWMVIAAFRYRRRRRPALPATVEATPV